MGFNLNNLIAKYINSDSSHSAKDVKDSINTLKNMAQEQYSKGERSIFEFSENEKLSQEDFLGLMGNYTGQSVNEIEDEVSVLFSILDEAGGDSDGKLSKDELGLFIGKSDNMNTFSVYNRFSTYKEETVDKLISTNNTANDTKNDNSVENSKSNDKTNSAENSTSNTKSADDSESLENLYKKLSYAKNAQERESINKEIENAQKKANLSDEDLKQSLVYKYVETRNSQNRELGNLYEKLRNTSSATERNEILQQINEKEEEFTKELLAIKDEKAALSKLPKEQSSVLNDLYDKLSNASTEKERNEIKSEIENKQNEFGLNKDEMALSIDLLSFSTELSFDNEIATLKQKYDSTTDEIAKDKIQALIDQKQEEKNIESSKLMRKFNSVVSELPKEQSDALNYLYDELANSKSMNEINKIIKNIEDKQKEFGLSTDQINMSVSSSALALDEAKSKILQNKYSELANLDSEDLKEEKWKEIHKIKDKFNNKLDTLYNKINVLNEISDLNEERKEKESLSKLPKEQTSVLNELYEKLSNAGTESERDSVIELIKKTQTEYGLSKDELALSREIQLISVRESQTKELYDIREKLENASSKEETEKIRAELNETKQNQKATRAALKREMISSKSNLPEKQSSVLNDLYSQLAGAKSEDERDSLIAKIKEKQLEFGLSKREIDLSLKQVNYSIIESQSNSLSKLYKDLGAAENNDIRDSIKSKIKQIKSENQAEQLEVKKEILQNKNAGINDDKISEKDKLLLQRYNIDIKKYNRLGDLYKEYSDADNMDIKNTINAKINQTKAEFDEESNSIQRKINKLSSKLPAEQLNVLESLYDDLSKANDISERNKILREIDKKQNEYLLDDSELELSKEQQKITLQKSVNTEMSGLYEQLRNSNSEDERNVINAKIKSLSEYFESIMKDIDKNT